MGNLSILINVDIKCIEIKKNSHWFRIFYFYNTWQKCALKVLGKVKI